MARGVAGVVERTGDGGFAGQTAEAAAHPPAGSPASTYTASTEAHSSYLGWLLNPTVLGLHVFRLILLRTLAIAACLCPILLSVQLLGMVNLLFTAQNVMIVTLEVCLLLLPPMIVIMLPFAVLMATHRTFDEMHEESELIVMAAIGRSRGQRAAPAMVAAGVLSALCLLLSLFVEPATNRMADQLKASIRVDILGQAAQTGGLHKIGDNLLVQIGGLAADGALIDVLIVDMRNAGGERIYFAKHGRASDLASGSSIVLSDGELLVKNRTANASSRVQFATYALSLADVLPQGGEPVARVQGKTTFELLVGCGEACRTGERRGIAAMGPVAAFHDIITRRYVAPAITHNFRRKPFGLCIGTDKNEQAATRLDVRFLIGEIENLHGGQIGVALDGGDLGI